MIVPGESATVSSAIRQSQEIRFAGTQHALSYRVHPHSNWSALTGVGIVGSDFCRDSSRSQCSSFPGSPVERITSIVARGQVNERHWRPTPQLLCDDVAHE